MTQYPKTYVIQAIAGDKYSLTVDHVDSAGDPIDLSGETISCKFYSKEVLQITLLSGTGLTITPLLGRVVIDLTEAQTTSLDGLARRRFVLRLDTSGETILTGPVEVQNV